MKPSKYIILILCGLFALNCSLVEISSAQEKPQQVYSYTVKGVIVSVPSSDNPRSKLKIKHEPIPDYVDETGVKVGMNAMIMPFDLKQGLTLENLKVGDKVEFVFESWWKPVPGDQITEIKKLEQK